MVPELSGTGRDTRTAIRRDGLEMFISSDSAFGPSVGGQDIVVNSTAFDGAPALSWDAQTLYFFSERTDLPHYGKRDLYMTSRTKTATP